MYFINPWIPWSPPPVDIQYVIDRTLKCTCTERRILLYLYFIIFLRTLNNSKYISIFPWNQNNVRNISHVIKLKWRAIHPVLVLFNRKFGHMRRFKIRFVQIESGNTISLPLLYVQERITIWWKDVCTNQIIFFWVVVIQYWNINNIHILKRDTKQLFNNEKMIY